MHNFISRVGALWVCHCFWLDR